MLLLYNITAGISCAEQWCISTQSFDVLGLGNALIVTSYLKLIWLCNDTFSCNILRSFAKALTIISRIEYDKILDNPIETNFNVNWWLVLLFLRVVKSTQKY